MSCPKHGPVNPCDGIWPTCALPLEGRTCDPSIPHCPHCGRELRS